MQITIDPHAVEKLEAAKTKLRAGDWGGTEAVCMMSAVVPGAKGVQDCVTAGWPEWLVELNVHLFDSVTGTDDEDAARFEFARAVAEAVQVPRDYAKARDLFLISTLERVKPHDTAGVVQPVIDLLRRRIVGDDVVNEMRDADAAARAAARAADAAAYAARAAADAADAARAAYAADAAAARAAGRAAAYAARAAARSDLIAALNAA